MRECEYRNDILEKWVNTSYVISMERIPNFNVVGKIEEKQKEFLLNGRKSLLYENHLANMEVDRKREIENNELPKTEEELQFINMSNEQTNELLRFSGVEPYDVPEGNFHKVKATIYKKYEPETTAGFFEAHYQMIMLNADFVPKNRLREALVIFHELLHMKSYLAYHVVAEDNGKGIMLHTSAYREGVDVKSSPKKALSGDDHDHFYGLNEAIVSHEEKRYLQKLLGASLFEKERQDLMSSETEPMKNILMKERRIPEDEFIAINLSEGYYLSIGYQAQRKVLNYICEQIAKDTNRSADDIHGEFLKSQITGKLVSLGKLVENSFGKGSFRRLGDMTEKGEDAMAVFDSLVKMREEKIGII